MTSNNSAGSDSEYDIIAMGSAVVDTFAKTDAETIRISGLNHGQKVDEQMLAYPLGSKILIKQLDFNIGGGGTNVSATFTKLGLKTGYIGKIGKDGNGHLIFDWLKKNNIDFLGQVGGQTGYSVILDSQEDDRTILTYKGANNELDFERIPKQHLKTKWFYSSSMVGKSFSTQEQLFVYLKHIGTKTAFNPSSYVTEKGLGHLKTILQHCDVLILNKEEAQLLVGKGTVKELAERLVEQGPGIIAITDGKKGALAYDKEKDEMWFVEPKQNLRVVETTGAGDAFASGFVAGLVKGEKLKQCALMGMFVSEGVIQAYGAKDHIPDEQEMKEFIASERRLSWHKVRRL